MSRLELQRDARAHAWQKHEKSFCIFAWAMLSDGILLAGLAEGLPVAPMADSQAWPQPATQEPLDAVVDDEADMGASFGDGGDGFQDDSDGDNGYQAGAPLNPNTLCHYAQDICSSILLSI